MMLIQKSFQLFASFALFFVNRSINSSSSSQMSPTETRKFKLRDHSKEGGVVMLCSRGVAPPVGHDKGAMLHPDRDIRAASAAIPHHESPGDGRVTKWRSFEGQTPDRPTKSCRQV